MSLQEVRDTGLRVMAVANITDAERGFVAAQALRLAAEPTEGSCVA
jgi:hypothetical protein